MRVSLVDVAKRIRDPRPGHLDVAQSEVGMQSLFKTKGSSSRVGCHKFDTELLAEAARSTKRNSAGHHFFVASSLSVDMLTIIVPATSAIESSAQAFVRTNPWSGAFGLSALCANHGKHIGMPPRMA